MVSRRYWGKVEQPNSLNSNEYLGFIQDKEGFRDTAYKPIDSEEHYTIGWGNYSPDVQAGDTITREEADIQLQKNIDDRLVQIRQAIPEFDNLPLEARQHLLGSWFRGSLSGSPKTIGLINEGKWQEASDEFLDNDEYRNTTLGGVKKRMKATSDAIRGLIT